MSKEWLEEIRKLLVNLYNAVDVDEEMKHYIFNDLKIEWLIEQAERVQELEKENRRYREAINNINETAMLFGTNEEVYDAIQDAIKILEESK